MCQTLCSALGGTLLMELTVESGKSLPVSDYQLQRQSSGSCGCVMGPGRAGGEGVSGQERLPGTLPWSRRVQAQRASPAPTSSEDIRPPLHSAAAVEGPGRSAQVGPPTPTHRGTWLFIALGKKSLPPPRRLNPSTVTLSHGGGEKGPHSRFPRMAWRIVLAPRKNLRPGSRSQPRGAPDGAGVGVTEQAPSP